MLGDWTAGRLPAVAATVAFGMGIDRGGVALVAHYNLPKTLEGFYQVGGRPVCGLASAACDSAVPRHAAISGEVPLACCRKVVLPSALPQAEVVPVALAALHSVLTTAPSCWAPNLPDPTAGWATGVCTGCRGGLHQDPPLRLGTDRLGADCEARLVLSN